MMKMVKKTMKMTMVKMMMTTVMTTSTSRWTNLKFRSRATRVRTSRVVAQGMALRKVSKVVYIISMVMVMVMVTRVVVQGLH